MLISALARATDETPRTLRFYEAAGLLPEPPRTTGNYRDYPGHTVDDIHFIRSLQTAGLTLDDIASIAHLRHNPQPLDSTDLALVAAAMARIDTRLDTLRRTRQDLDALTDQTQTEHPAPHVDWAPNNISNQHPTGGPRRHGRLRALNG